MLTPLENLKLIGHQKAQELFLQHLRENTMPHAWLMTGAKGIGKATLAYHFARCLLSGSDKLSMSADHPVYRRMLAHSSTDFLCIEPEYDEKKEEYKTEINVERMRPIGEFLSLTPAEGTWRVIIIDSADELNTHAANALLKNLEEPPKQTVIFLISHNPGKLLPTIRSRCRVMPITPLNELDYSEILTHTAPDLLPTNAEKLGILSRYSPGLALELNAQDALKYYSNLLQIMRKMPKFTSKDILEYSNQFTAKQTHSQWKLHIRLFSILLERLVNKEGRGVIDQEDVCHAHLLQLRPVPFWLDIWQAANHEFLLAERLHLDYKTVIIGFFEQLMQKVNTKYYAAA